MASSFGWREWCRAMLLQLASSTLRVALALIGVIIWWGWDYAQRGGVQSMAGLESVSMFWAYVAMPVGGVFSAIGIVGNLLDPQRLELETAQ